MKDPKIRIDRPDISDEQALQHKNFDSVLNQAQGLQPPSSPGGFPKINLWGGGAILVAAIAVGVLYFSDHNTSPVDNANIPVPVVVDQDEESAVHPPIDGIDVPYEIFNVTAGTAEQLTSQNGSTIEIPENAFVDANGNPVSGAIEIRYREFHDPVDFFLSGIPMVYDSAGSQYTFESAGMLEILAYKDGVPVHIDEEAPVSVEMVSHQQGNQFNIYELDDKTGQWEFVYKDTADGSDNYLTDVDDMLKKSTPKEVGNVLNKELKTAKKAIASIQKVLPPAPQKANKKRFNIKIDYDAKEFPELVAYDGVLFEITDDNDNFDASLAEQEWEYVSVKKKSSKVTLMFRRGREKHSFITEPVFEGKNYSEAMNLFEEKNASYLEQLKAREKEEATAEKQLKYLALKMDKDRKADDELAAMRRKARLESLGTESTVRRTFVINGFGIWNSDCPLSLPQGRMLAAKFVDGKGDSITLASVYLVEQNKNAMFKIYNDRYPVFGYNPGSKNVLWGITEDQKLAYYTFDDFSKLEQTVPKDSVMFTMRTIDKKLTKAREVRQILGLDI